MKDIRTIGGAVYSMDFDATGRTVLGCTSDNQLRAYDVATGEARPIHELAGRGSNTWDVSRDGRYIAGPVRDGIGVWDARTLALVRTIPCSPAYVTISPDGRCVAASCEDGIVRLWETTSGRLIASPLQDAGSGNLRFSADGRTLSVFAGGTLRTLGHTRNGRVPPIMPVRPPRKGPVVEPSDD